MGIRVRTFLRSTVLFVLVAGPLMPALAAAPVAYNFSGKILSVSAGATTATGVVVNDTITGGFAYDPTQVGTSGDYTFTGSSKVHSLSFKIFDSGGNQVFTDSYSGNVSAYYAMKVIYGFTSNPQYPGVNGTELDIKGDTIYKQGLGISGPSIPAFVLSLFDPGNVGTSPTNPLPNATVIKNFVSNKALLTWDPPDQSFSAEVSFEGVGVPEPASLVTGVLGIVTCAVGYLIFHRKPAGDPRSGRHALSSGH
jgi:hypothetical protein